MKNKIGSMFAVLSFVSFVMSSNVVCCVLGADGPWTSKAPMQHPRAALGAAVVDGRLYAIGGYSSQLDEETHFYRTVNATEEYDPVADVWTEKTQMQTPRADLAAATLNDTIYAIGGGRALLQADSADVWQYTPIGQVPEFQSWLIIPLFMTATLSSPLVYKKLTKTA